MKPSNELHGKCLDTAQAAESLGVSKQTMAIWRYEKYGPAYVKIRNRVWYPVAELEQFRKQSAVLVRPKE